MPPRDPGKPPADQISRARNLRELRDSAAGCRRCDLWQHATQTVFGAGAPRATILFIGEQPGNQEDIEGKPFVGPAGLLLQKALHEAGIDRAKTYVTNAVKPFKWEPRGKRRIHKRPNSTEIAACRPSLDAEIAKVQPRVIVCLGATAAQSLLGRVFRVTQHRGEFVDSPLAPFVMATIHPSAILRAPDDETRHTEMRRFIADLKKIARALSE